MQQVRTSPAAPVLKAATHTSGRPGPSWMNVCGRDEHRAGARNAACHRGQCVSGARWQDEGRSGRARSRIWLYGA